MFFRCYLREIDVDFGDESIDVILIREHPNGFEPLFMSYFSPNDKDGPESENDDGCYDGYRNISHTLLPDPQVAPNSIR